ncbi:MAG: TetR family transcriptional regulator [Deltaproteobacteria bacterium]|nr:TetR family transcriptional regulator [Deltaproteobacteria bacterium]
MKISNEKKLETRLKLIKVAVEIVSEKGLKGTTMKAIAKAAHIGEATIYNYFPTKEAILFAYYEHQLQTGAERLKSIPGFNKFTLQEQLQAFLETNLELFLPDREFIQETFKMVFFSLFQQVKQMQAIRDLFSKIINDLFEAAVEVGEIPKQAFQEILLQFVWDYYIGIIIYWSKDSSDQFNNTSILIDKSLHLACSLLKAGIVNKLFDITQFLFKQHILSRFDFFCRQVDTLHQIKREFMSEPDEKRNTPRKMAKKRRRE